MNGMTRRLVVVAAVVSLIGERIAPAGRGKELGGSRSGLQAGQDRRDCGQDARRRPGRRCRGQELYKDAYGWAAFSDMKIAFGFSGGGGIGVAVSKASGKRTYMEMGEVGRRLRPWRQEVQVLFLFQEKPPSTASSDKGWQADASAPPRPVGRAPAPRSASSTASRYQISDKGLMATADIARTKYLKTTS